MCEEGEVGWAYGIGTEKDCGATFGFVDVWIVEIIGWVDACLLIGYCSLSERIVAYQHRRGISVLPRPPLIPYLIHYIYRISIGPEDTSEKNMARRDKQLSQIEFGNDPCSGDQKPDIHSPMRI